MKKLVLSVATAIFSITLMAAPTAVNEKVLKAFEASFKDAKQVVWEEHPNTYEVKFVHNEIKARITYDPDGNIVKTIRYYFEDSLPLFIRGKIKERYAGKRIFGVTEVASQDELNYHIVLEDEKTWTNIICDAHGYMRVDKKFKKA